MRLAGLVMFLCFLSPPCASVFAQGPDDITAETELKTDDGGPEAAYVKSGVIIVNRLTPASYPATLKKIRVFCMQPGGIPSVVGQTLRLVAFADPTGSGKPTATSFAVDQGHAVTVAGQFTDYEVNGPTITSGDFYVGYEAPKGTDWVQFAVDSSSPAQGRAFFSKKAGKPFKPMTPVNGASVNFLIRAVVVQEIGDFELAADSISQTVSPGNSVSFRVSCRSVGGFSQPVELRTVVSSPTLTAGLSSAALMPGETGTLTVTAGSSTPPGIFGVTVIGTSAGAVRSLGLSVEVKATGDFSISVSPTTQTVSQGGTAIFSLSTRSVGQFTQTITFGVSNLPLGMSAEFSPASAAPGFGSTLFLRTSTSTSPGGYTISVFGRSGSVTRSQAVTVTVGSPGDFSISLSPSSQSVTAGQSATFTVFTDRTGSFNQTISLSVSSGLSASVSPSSVSPGGTASVSVGTSTSTSAGTYTVTVTGRAGSVTKTATATTTVSTSSSSACNITVWVNTDSGVYHCPGSFYYGNTKHGKYMSQCAAQAAGYRPANNKPCT